MELHIRITLVTSEKKDEIGADERAHEGRTLQPNIAAG